MSDALEGVSHYRIDDDNGYDDDDGDGIMGNGR